MSGGFGREHGDRGPAVRHIIIRYQGFRPSVAVAPAFQSACCDRRRYGTGRDRCHRRLSGRRIHNAAAFHMETFADTDPSTFESPGRTMCLGAGHGAQRIISAMLAAKRGVLLFVGASACVKAGADFSPLGSASAPSGAWSMSLARELGPQGIHVDRALGSRRRSARGYPTPIGGCDNPHASSQRSSPAATAAGPSAVVEHALVEAPPREGTACKAAETLLRQAVRTALGLLEVPLDGVAHQIGATGELQFALDLIAVRLDGFDAEM